MSKVHFVRDDQILFNNALKALSISWTNSSSTGSQSIEAWVGHTPVGLKVTLLPQGVACRGVHCVEEMKERVYIWHHGGNKHRIGKMSEKAGQDGVWFLRQDWESFEGSTVYGIEWLSKIAIQD